MNRRLDALIYAFESGEDIDLLIEALSAQSREVRELGRWLLSETQLEEARQALRAYLPYSRMKCLHEIKGQNKVEPNYFAISSDQKVLLSNCYSDTGKYDAYTDINIWDLQTGKLVDRLYSLHEHMATDQSGTIILSGFLNRLEVLENWRGKLTYRMLSPRLAHDEAYEYLRKASFSEIGSLVVSRDGSVAVYGPYGHSWDGNIVVWDLRAEKIIHLLQWQTSGGGTSQISALMISPDGTILLSQDSRRGRHNRKGIPCPPDLNKLWNVQTGELIREFETSAHWVAHEIATTLERRYFASGIRDNSVKVWNIETDEIIYSFPECSHTTMTPDGKVLAYSDDINNIKLRDLDTNQQICSLLGGASPIKAICLSSDREWVASYGADATIRIYGLPE